MMATDRHALAVAIFERRCGFAWTEEYEGSREWSDAQIEADAVDDRNRRNG